MNVADLNDGGNACMIYYEKHTRCLTGFLTAVCLSEGAVVVDQQRGVIIFIDIFPREFRIILLFVFPRSLSLSLFYFSIVVVVVAPLPGTVSASSISSQ